MIQWFRHSAYYIYYIASSTTVKWLGLFLQKFQNLWDLSSSHGCSWRVRSSEMWLYVLGWVVPDIKRDHSVFIFRVKHLKKNGLLGWLYPEDEGTMITLKVGNYLPNDKTLHTKRLIINFIAGLVSSQTPSEHLYHIHMLLLK